MSELIAQGRAADVFAYGDGLVLRRYRTDYNCEYEARVMEHVRSHGLPVPKVVDANGRDLVMERLDGVTMLSDFPKHPSRMFQHARTIASLFSRLHAIPTTEWMKRKHPSGNVLVHLDLHPDNVMLTSRGPVVIDWSNAGVGNGDVEVADLWLVMACAKVPGGFVDRTLAAAFRSLFVRTFLSAFDKPAVAEALPLALENRSRDRNMSEEELAKMRVLVTKNAS
ncbi:MAG TPA: phosphotransferase [Actinomycetota bacterium]|nr:phosphotransferase [Actinomycetota bacterium]